MRCPPLYVTWKCGSDCPWQEIRSYPTAYAKGRNKISISTCKVSRIGRISSNTESTWVRICHSCLLIGINAFKQSFKRVQLKSLLNTLPRSIYCVRSFRLRVHVKLVWPFVERILSLREGSLLSPVWDLSCLASFYCSQRWSAFNFDLSTAFRPVQKQRYKPGSEVFIQFIELMQISL